MSDLRSDSEAWRLVLDNDRLTHHLVRKFLFGERASLVHRFGDYDDALQVARLGLFKAALTWDSGQGSTFAGHASRGVFFALRQVVQRLDRQTASLSVSNRHDREWIKDLAATTPDPAQAIADRDQQQWELRRVHQALAGVPEDRRWDFLAVATGEQSQADLAKERGSTREAARQRYERVRVAVCRILQES